MSMNQALLAQRLKEARESSQITQETAAEALGIPRTAMVHIEAGNRSISTLELAELAKLYRRSIASFFSEAEENAEDDALLALYRVDPAFEEDPRLQESVSKCIEICVVGRQLEEILDTPRRSGPPEYSLQAPRNLSEAVQQGQRVAGEERKRLGMGDSPVSDMAELISTQGVWASDATLPEEMSGLFLRHPSIGMTILINAAHPRSRKRFSYAHEFAHCLLDRAQSVSITTPANQKDLSEVRANAFAAAFLMPESGVSSFLDSLDKGGPSRQTLHVYSPAGPAEGSTTEAQRRPATGSQRIVYQDVARLARHLGVSYAAAVYRLRNLNRISQPECTALLVEDVHARSYLNLLGIADDSSNKRGDGRHLVVEVACLAMEAYRREQISRGKLMEVSALLKLGKDLIALVDVGSGG